MNLQSHHCCGTIISAGSLKAPALVLLIIFGSKWWSFNKRGNYGIGLSGFRIIAKLSRVTLLPVS